MYYVLAAKDVYSTSVRLSKANITQLNKLDARLRRDRISPQHYAYGLMKHLKKWVNDKGWRVLPVNVFAGEWAYKLYTSRLVVGDYEIKPTDETFQMLVMEHYMVLQYSDYCGDYETAVEELKPILSRRWKNMRGSLRDNVIAQALDLYTKVRNYAQ